MMAHVCNPRLRQEDQLGLYTVSQAILGYTERPCLKNKQTNNLS
jgi:hypothetical protein